MLRVTAGKYRGRKIFTGKQLAARPTMSVVREAIFNMLLARITIHNSSVLDLFCGSGALSFEAISRGSKHAFMVDSDYYNLQLPSKTAETLGVTDKITLICCSADKLPKPIAQCGIVFIDPPYNSNLVGPTLSGLASSGWLSDDAVVILEIKKDEDFPPQKDFNIALERVYGIAKILFLTRCTDI